MEGGLTLAELPGRVIVHSEIGPDKDEGSKNRETPVIFLGLNSLSTPSDTFFFCFDCVVRLQRVKCFIFDRK